MGVFLLQSEEALKKAFLPAQLALKYHPFYKGKVQMTLKVPVRSYDDFAIWYTPGVAEPCKLIHKDPEQVFEHTNRGNTIAVISDGTRILGLGDIGPEAGLPVMEGKALLFKYLGGVDAIPLVLNVREADEIIKVVKALEPSFGGINLEDIEKPKCFYILETLRKQMNIPVWHDDQQGTATVTTAALINALKVVGKKINDVVIAMIGAGAANIAIARLMIAAGVDPGKIRMVDSRGILYAERDDVDKLQFSDPWKYEMAIKTNKDRVTGGIPESLKGADVVIAMSKPGPGVIKKEWVEQMADNAIVFACANPIPEIWPWEAKEAGARIVATGRSDFPNQVNNSLGFPGIFRGALDVRARTITDEMCLAAANELAKVAEEKGLSEDYIIPTMEDWEVYPREAAAVGMKAMEQGVARVKYSRDELLEMAYEKIRAAREMVKLLMKEGFILPPPE
ncbi:MAG: NADP-dependent malic enzyme [Nitrososphaerota archaeon]